MIISAGVSIVAFFGAFGEFGRSFSPFIALFVAIIATPAIALATKGKYYIKRPDVQPEARFTPDGTPATTKLDCAVCGQTYERPDMVDCSFHEARSLLAVLHDGEGLQDRLPRQPDLPRPPGRRTALSRLARSLGAWGVPRAGE